VSNGSNGTQAQGGKQAFHGLSPFVVGHSDSGDAACIVGTYLMVASQAVKSSSTRLTARLEACAAAAAS